MVCWANFDEKVTLNVLQTLTFKFIFSYRGLYHIGEAYVNECEWCVGGNSRRPADFGADKCGNCRKAPGYLEEWDCHGTCYGNATYDKCGVCVGKMIQLIIDFVV